MDVIDRYLREEKEPDIHMMILYTADIEEAKTSMERTACRLQVEASYLAGAPSEEWMEDARKRIEEGGINDEMLMHLVILPLTYKGGEKKQYIKEVLGMTQVGKMLMDEGRQEGRQEGLRQGDMERARKTALNMLKRGDSLNDVAEVLELPADMIKAWEEGACAMV